MFRKTLLPLGSAALIGALLLPTIVGASPLSPGPSGSTASGIPAGAVMVPMTAAVATMVTNLGNGTSDVTYSNGQTISVATNVASQIYVGSGAFATPDGVVTGNCGYSWLDLAKNSANGVTGSTGYEVNSRVGVPEAFEWAVHTDILQAPIGQYNSWGGATTHTYWFHGYTFDQGHATYASDVFDGYVIGTLTTCFSGNPSDIINT
jgi:hypothetical protein